LIGGLLHSRFIRVAHSSFALTIAACKSGGNLFVKRATVFYWLIGIVIATAAIAVSFHFDDSVRDLIARHQNSAVRNFMRYVSLFGNWPSHAAAGLILLGLAWRRGNQKWTRIFLAMLLAMLLAGVTGTVIKRTIPRARPSVHAEARWGGPRLSSKYHSFPSGHVGASTAFFGVLFIARRRVGFACLSIPILIGFSRMYIGAHYLSDIVCAAVLGTLCTLVVVHFVPPNRQSPIAD
jgi:membrane-associated phospholipid phosphatase